MIAATCCTIPMTLLFLNPVNYTVGEAVFVGLSQASCILIDAPADPPP